MDLTEKEKILLTALHNAKLVNWKFLPAFEEFLEEYVSLEGVDLRSIVENFVECGLLNVKEINESEVICSHTHKVHSDMLYEELTYYGYGFIEGHD